MPVSRVAYGATLSLALSLVLALSVCGVHAAPRPHLRRDSNITQLCVVCRPGSYATPNCTLLPNKTVVECTSGYCAVDALANCSLCAPGWYQNEPHQIKCVPCPPGTFAHNPGVATCDLCTRGHFCNESALTEPRTCEVGYYCPDEGMVAPTPCDPGYTCESAGLVAPVPCAPGFFCRGGKRPPSPCPAGYACPGVTAVPVPCAWLFQSGPQAASCSPSAGFFVIVVVASLALIVFCIWLFLRLSKRAAQRAEQSRSNEITGLIPASTGPTYSGL